MEETEFSLESRVLCSDGACIGTVGPDGLCKVCGKAYEGDEDLSGLRPLSSPLPPAEEGETDQPISSDSDSLAGSTVDPDERVCCPDDTCIGIIGPDGKCGTCGRKL